jgi:hypothetical protein
MILKLIRPRMLPLALLLAAGAAAQDFSSTNLTRLDRFWAALERGDAPVTVVAFGDSLQADYRSVGTHLFPQMQSAWGRAGLACFDPWGASLSKGGGATSSGPDTNWWHYHTVLPPGGYAYWHEAYGDTASTPADFARLFYIATPDGGEFTVSFSTNGGAWISNTTVSAAAPAAEARCLSLAVGTNLYRLRVDSVSGTNLVLGVQLGLAHSNGVTTLYLARDGMNLGQFFSTADRVLTPVFAHLQPSLILWHMKELWDAGQDPATLSNRLERLEELWRTNCPNADVLYVGTPYDTFNDTDGRTATQNALVRALALRHDRAYVDGMTAMVSFNSMQTNGYLDDTVHPSNLYYQWLANAVWRQGLFSLIRKDRTLQAATTADGWAVGCPGFTNVNQSLLASSNLVDWAEVATHAPGAQRWWVTNPPGNFFRVRYRAPD